MWVAWPGLTAGDPTALAEVYSPATRTWSLTGNISTPKMRPTLTLLPNNMVGQLQGCVALCKDTSATVLAVFPGFLY